MWHQLFKLNVMRLREYFLCEKKTKIMTFFNNFFSSMSVFSVHCLYILVSVSKAGQKIASHPLCPNFQTCSWWLFYVQRASSSALNKAQRILVLHQNTGSCVRSNTCMCRDTVVNVHQRLRPSCPGTTDEKQPLAYSGIFTWMFLLMYNVPVKLNTK